MHRNRFSLRKLKYYSIISSSLCGITLIAALIMLFGFAGSKTDLPGIIISFMLILSVGSGGFLSGYLYGKKKRHKGIINGAICGMILYALLFLFGIIYLKGIPPFRFSWYLLLLSVSGASGGVKGVNSRIKRPPV